MTQELTLSDVLRCQKQCDESGELCIVSRQAADEAADAIERLTETAATTDLILKSANETVGRLTSENSELKEGLDSIERLTAEIHKLHTNGESRMNITNVSLMPAVK